MNYSNEVRKSFATIKEMLRDRGVDAETLTSVSPDDVVAMSGSGSVFHLDVPSCAHRIVYDMNPKFKLADVRKLLEDDAVAVALVVTKDQAGPTHAALKGVAELGKDVQFFDIRELQFNVSRHVLVPRHEPIRAEPEIEDVLKRYSLKSRFMLPLILSNDPMARYLALKPGQIVRIDRNSPSAGTYVLYRCCMRA
jgi:DNA-directed RNA polymerase I, II, and III subunit RPABC1